MATKIDTEMYCSRCREELNLAEMHYNEQDDGGALCDTCLIVLETGECYGMADDGSGFFVVTRGIQ